MLLNSPPTLTDNMRLYAWVSTEYMYATVEIVMIRQGCCIKQNYCLDAMGLLVVSGYF